MADQGTKDRLDRIEAALFRIAAELQRIEPETLHAIERVARRIDEQITWEVGNAVSKLDERLSTELHDALEVIRPGLGTEAYLRGGFRRSVGNKADELGLSGIERRDFIRAQIAAQRIESGAPNVVEDPLPPGGLLALLPRILVPLHHRIVSRRRSS